MLLLYKKTRRKITTLTIFAQAIVHDLSFLWSIFNSMNVNFGMRFGIILLSSFHYNVPCSVFSRVVVLDSMYQRCWPTSTCDYTVYTQWSFARSSVVVAERRVTIVGATDDYAEDTTHRGQSVCNNGSHSSIIRRRQLNCSRTSAISSLGLSIQQTEYPALLSSWVIWRSVSYRCCVLIRLLLFCLATQWGSWK